VGTSPASPEAARSMGASGIAASEFPDLRWKEHQLGSKLPVLLYLTHHDRDMKTKKGTSSDVVRWVEEWFAASSMYREAVPVDLMAKQLSQILSAKAVKKKYGVEVDKTGRVQEYSIISCTWGSWMETLVALPADWSIQRRASGS
ncbi:unnamed protein product, partial [Pylaiella littoralis]